MTQVILGGGLTALLARDILCPKWTIIPIGKSRFYSFNPPLADNYIIQDAVIDNYLKKFYFIPILHKTAYSITGQLLYNHSITLQPYLEKLYGDNVPPHAHIVMSRRSFENFGCGDCADIYKNLQIKYRQEILENNTKYGVPKSIVDHTLTTSTGLKFEYKKIISTIPLYALLETLRININLPSRDIYYYHVKSEDINLEGATHALVVDPEIQFFKVSKLSPDNYIFYSCKQIEFPGQYFMNFMKKFELIGETLVEKAIPCGAIPRIKEIGDADIQCVGKYANWDDCIDLTFSIKKLIG